MVFELNEVSRQTLKKTAFSEKFYENELHPISVILILFVNK